MSKNGGLAEVLVQIRPMSADSKRRFDGPTVAQQRFLSLFSRNGAGNPVPCCTLSPETQTAPCVMKANQLKWIVFAIVGASSAAEITAEPVGDNPLVLSYMKQQICWFTGANWAGLQT